MQWEQGKEVAGQVKLEQMGDYIRVLGLSREQKTNKMKVTCLAPLCMLYLNYCSVPRHSSRFNLRKDDPEFIDPGKYRFYIKQTVQTTAPKLEAKVQQGDVHQEWQEQDLMDICDYNQGQDERKVVFQETPRKDQEADKAAANAEPVGYPANEVQGKDKDQPAAKRARTDEPFSMPLKLSMAHELKPAFPRVTGGPHTPAAH